MFSLRFHLAPGSASHLDSAEQDNDSRVRRWIAHGRVGRALVGTVGTTFILCAGAFVFGPFSDLSTLQLAAGPRATSASSRATASIVMAHTGRAWGSAAQQRQAAAASAPLARIARSDGLGAP